MKLAFGLMRLPIIDNDNSKINLEAFKEMVDEFIASGGTYFDTAWPYHSGNSELAFKKVVFERYDRSQYTLTDKMPMFAIKEETDLETIFNKQLEKTGVSYFDYYWLHALNKNYYETVKKTKAFDFILKKKQEGKIKHIGFSFHDSYEVLETILMENPKVEFVQLQINYIDWLDDTNVQSRLCYEVCKKYNKPVMVMEPVKGGALVNVPEKALKLMRDYNPNASTASWAIRYVASLDNVFMVLSGMSNLEQMKDNLSYMKDFKPLNEEEKTIINEVANIIKNNISIQCTNCRYCISENKCPMNICIPDYFSIYNDKKAFNIKKGSYTQRYEELNKTYGKASECLKCGMCETHCPQHLSIRDHLATIAKELEK